MADGELTMFGKAYDTVGSTNKNLVLQTRGDLKVRWGNKYIDLIKNGKINVDVDLLKKASNKDEIFKDGIYVIDKEEGQEVWLYIGGTLINLMGEIGTTYVSFIGTLEVDVEKKYLALINAGFYYKTYADATAANIKSGLIYVDEQHLLYYAKEGLLNKYEQALTVPDPLIIGGITIDGKSARIYGGATLSFGIATTDYISLTEKGVVINQPMITTNNISSDIFEHNVSGYSIYYDSAKKWHCMELDYLYVRNLIEYEGIEDILYDDLVTKVNERQLVKGKKYRIIDFQNEWQMEYIEYDANGLLYHQYWPVILTAKSDTEFENLGYFCDNEEWIIEYDLNYHYYVNSGVGPKGDYWTLYTKGRITKLTDQNGNSGNYDFKHRKFKYTGSTDDKTTQYYTYSVVNPYYNSLEDVSFDKENKFLDATELEKISEFFPNLKTIKIVNNTINIREPDIETITILDGNGNNMEVEKVFIHDDHILFPLCQTYFPYENKILASSGTYIITYPFYKNTIGGLYLNVTDVETISLNYDFYENIFDDMYMIGEYIEPIGGVTTLPTTSSKRITITTNKQFILNTGKNVTNATFKGHTRTNIFLDITNTFFEHDIENNEFGERLEDTHFYCAELKNNKFKGFIDTNYQIEDFTIDGIITNNIFNRIVKAKIKGTIKNSTFNDIKPDTGLVGCKLYGRIEDCIFHDILGCDFKDTSEIVYVKFFDEMYLVYYDIESSTIEGSMYKVAFTDKVIYTDFKGIVRNTNFYKQVGLLEADRITLNNIDGSNFYGAIKKLNANNSSITACTFNADINEATIIGTLNDCQFQALNGGIIIGEDGGSISNMTIQIDISPTSAQYAESAENSSILIEVNPFKITPTGIPRLALTAHKECFVQDKYYSGSNKKTFIVQLSSDDNTPSGVIVMFSGTVAQIPKGYAICDGTNGTPDLTGRFIRSVSKNLDNTFEAAGAKDNNDLEAHGSDPIRRYLKKTPKHTHTFKTYNTNLTADTTNFNIGYASGASTSLTVDTSNLGITIDNETLVLTNYYEKYGSRVIGDIVQDSNAATTTWMGSQQTTAGLEHNHTGRITGTATVSGSFPAIQVSGSITVPINYTPELETTETGFVEAVNVEPLAYALIFIMKL